MKNYYTVLNIDPISTQDQIKKAYRFLAFKFHPDKHNGDEFFKKKFLEVQEAYTILTDPIKKQAYDSSLHRFLDQNNFKEQSREEAYTEPNANNQSAPNNVDQSHYVYWAQQYFNKGNWEKAIEEIEKALKIYPNYGYFYYIKADIYRSINLPNGALKLYKKAFERGYLDAKENIIELETLKNNLEKVHQKVLINGIILLSITLGLVKAVKPPSYDNFGYSLVTTFTIFILWWFYLFYHSRKISSEAKNLLNTSLTMNILVLLSIALMIGIQFF